MGVQRRGRDLIQSGGVRVLLRRFILGLTFLGRLVGGTVVFAQAQAIKNGGKSCRASGPGTLLSRRAPRLSL